MNKFQEKIRWEGSIQIAINKNVYLSIRRYEENFTKKFKMPKIVF